MYTILCNKNVGHRVHLRENEHLFRCRFQLGGKLLRCVRARAHLPALMTRKSCGVGMHNAKLRNHLKIHNDSQIQLKGTEFCFELYALKLKLRVLHQVKLWLW